MRECVFMELQGRLRRLNAKNKPDPALIAFCKENFLYYSIPNSLTGREIVNRVVDGSFTGFVTCDIRVREPFREQFSRFPPIYVHKLLGRSDLCPVMKEYVEANNLLQQPQKLLVSVLGCRQLSLLSTYLRHLILECHCEVTNVSRAVFYRLEPICRSYFMNNLQQRIEAQKQDQIGRSNAKKLESNSIYGVTCMDKGKHNEVFIADAKTALRMASHPRYRHTNMIVPNQYYQIVMAKRAIKMNVPVQLAVSILNLAKIELNRFVWNFVDRFFGPRVELSFIDTDSCYFAGCFPALDQHVLDEDRESYEKAKKAILAINPEHKFEPLRWKMELNNGTCFLGCSSKSYFIERENEASYWKNKGTSKKTNNLVKENYKKAIFDRETTVIENRGFRYSKATAGLFSCKTVKRGVTFKYLKRALSPNGVHTRALDL